MTENKQNNNDRTDRRPDCVTEIRMGNSVLTVSGFFKQGATDTASKAHAHFCFSQSFLFLNPPKRKKRNKIGGKLSALDKKKLVLTNIPYALAAFYACLLYTSRCV